MTMATTKLLILTTSGKLYFWQTGDPVLTRVVFLGVPRVIYPVHFACSSDFVYLTAPNGDFFFGDWLKIPSVPIAQMSEISSDRHSRSLLNDFSRFYEELDEESADLIIECGNVKFPAHKFILASRSKYFAEKLKCDSKVNFIKAPEGLSANVFGQALRSIYFTELQNQVLQQTKSTNSKAVNKLNAGATSAVNSALKTLQVDSFDDG
uniref:BTB domain-containing protein n=1 Tax=Romanomermis culicivorax TaxID=13658 RepID=A0A915KRC3_ROMCU